MRPVVGLSMGQILPCLFFIQSTSFSESKYALFYQLWFANLIGGNASTCFVLILLSCRTFSMLIDSSRLGVLAFGWRRSRELVCHIDYLLLMTAKIARNASSSIDGTDLAQSLLHPEHVFLWIEVCAFLSVVVCQPGRWLPTLAP